MYNSPEAQLISLQTLAAEHAVSIRTVRDVLKRLADDGVVTRVERWGYIAPALQADDVAGQYIVTRNTLESAFKLLGKDSELGKSSRESIKQLLALVRDCSDDDYQALTDYTGTLFTSIVSLTNHTGIMSTICLSNKELYYVRLLECQEMNEVKENLEYLCVLLLSHDWDGLIEAVHDYHRQRIDILPTLIRPTSR